MTYLRLLAVVEGVSLLVLFFVAMPLKYQFDMPQAVTLAGWVHGVLFMVFVLYASSYSQRQQWRDSLFFQLLLSSMIPFGMVYMDRKLKAISIRHQSEKR